MFLSSSDLLSNVGQFITNLFQDFTSGLLFFGGPLEIVVSVLDILATALVIYYVLKILRDSRAWQLLKGLILIISFAVLCSLVGLTTVGFLLNNTISVLAIAFVVIFQPELRRALETVGRSSFNVISSAISQDELNRTKGSVHNLIESIVRACEKMIESGTGALIILERQTKLSELIEQENVVQLDAAVSSTILQQIFYKGSPLHDGAVLIRDGRLAAARIHVPLSDNYHLRKDYGTRHRAAIGASEMGDAIAVVVSEERGCISLTLEGRLYTMDNGDALRTLLHKLLSPARPGVSFGNLGKLFRSSRILKDQLAGESVSAGQAAQQPVRKVRPASRIVKKRRVLLLSASLAISIVLWLYVQVTVNPVETRTFSVPLTYSGVELVDRNGVEFAQTNGLEFAVTPQNIQVTLQGRKRAIDDLTSDEVIAYLDCTVISAPGTARLDVQIDIGGLMYLRPNRISPSSVSLIFEAISGD